MTRAELLPRAAPVAVAELQAAAMGVGPQRSYEGAQNGLDVVSEKDALMLGVGWEKGRRLHTDTHK